MLDGAAPLSIDATWLSGTSDSPNCAGQIELQQVAAAGRAATVPPAGGHRSCRRRGPRTAKPPGRPPGRARWRRRCPGPGPGRRRVLRSTLMRNSGRGCSSLVSTSAAPGTFGHHLHQPPADRRAAREIVAAQADLDRRFRRSPIGGGRWPCGDGAEALQAFAHVGHDGEVVAPGCAAASSLT